VIRKCPPEGGRYKDVSNLSSHTDFVVEDIVKPLGIGNMNFNVSFYCADFSASGGGLVSRT
jgi:hypothetical protein